MPINNQNIIIDIQKVNYKYGLQPVLSDINLKIGQGDYIGIIGPNGGGKTTLLKIILGLIKPDSGQVKIFNQDIKYFAEKYRIGYVPQRAINFDFAFPATVTEVVGMGRFAKLGLLHTIGKSDLEIIHTVLDQVEMSEYKNHLIGKLSSGQQQRVFIARALASQPEILFLDEPTVGVDTPTQESFYKLLKDLNQNQRITLILVSHDIDVIANEVNLIACLNQKIVYCGKPKEFIKADYLEHLYGHGLKHILHGH
jgi:zinc transport system ATP-binding protein